MNCTAYNTTAYTMQFTCIPGNDGGIKQSFFVEVINFFNAGNISQWNVVEMYLKFTRFCLKFESICDILCYSYKHPLFFLCLKVFDGDEKIFNVSSEHPTFLLRKLPSDSKLVIKVRKVKIWNRLKENERVLKEFRFYKLEAKFFFILSLHTFMRLQIFQLKLF